MEVGILPLGNKEVSVPGRPPGPARHQKHWSRHFAFSFHSLVKYSNCASFTSMLSQLFEQAHWPSTVLGDSGLSWEEPGFCHQTDLPEFKRRLCPCGSGGAYLVCFIVLIWQISGLCYRTWKLSEQVVIERPADFFKNFKSHVSFSQVMKSQTRQVSN